MLTMPEAAAVRQEMEEIWQMSGLSNAIYRVGWTVMLLSIGGLVLKPHICSSCNENEEHEEEEAE